MYPTKAGKLARAGKIANIINNLIVVVLQEADDVIKAGFDDQDYVRIKIHVLDGANEQDVRKVADFEIHFGIDTLAECGEQARALIRKQRLIAKITKVFEQFLALTQLGHIDDHVFHLYLGYIFSKVGAKGGVVG